MVSRVKKGIQDLVSLEMYIWEYAKKLQSNEADIFLSMRICSEREKKQPSVNQNIVGFELTMASNSESLLNKQNKNMLHCSLTIFSPDTDNN